MNNFASKKNSELDLIGETASAILTVKYAQFGIAQSVAENLSTMADDFHAQRAAAKSAQDAATHATAVKDQARANLLGMLAQVSATVYGPASVVSDAQLASIGFAPRRSGSARPTPAQRVLGFAAVPNADGSVRLSWDRSGNARTAIFALEASVDSGATWTGVGMTSRTKAMLDGFAPGVATWFRVTANTATTTALPSAAVAIYGPQPAARFELKVA